MVQSFNRMSNRFILKDDEGALVVRYSTDLVKKTVRGMNSVGLTKKTPKEIVEREINALKLLSGVPGIQRFVRQESEDTIYTEFVEGVSLFQFKGKVGKEYFDELEIILEECYKNGVYRIGQNRTDYLITKENKQIVIDFGNAFFDTDLASSIPGVIGAIKGYTSLRLFDLKRRYT